MKDILFECEDCTVFAEVEGLKLTYRYDNSYIYTTRTLLNDNSYNELKHDLQKVYDAFVRAGDIDAVVSVFEFLDSEEMGRYCRNDEETHYDGRTHDEIRDYLNEADDKLQLTSLYERATKTPLCKRDRATVERIFEKYPDIPKEGYTRAEHYYWLGIVSALSWALGEERFDPDNRHAYRDI